MAEAVSTSAYQRGWRRMLVDMEVPGFDVGFLRDFDPIAKADLYARADLASVMFSCKALTGLCFWPTDVGEAHPGIGGRDVVGETAAALAERGIAACAYYSVIYDNWAYEHHPDWRFDPVYARSSPTPSPSDRHGLCCPNNPGYRDFIAAQIADLYGRYDFECAFCDMSFWPGVCGCAHCRDRLRAEEGIELPETVDWTDPAWCAFQAARERWITDFQSLVTDSMREARPGIAVYHNFASAPYDWTLGVPFKVTEQSDFLGGDLYGDALEQLVLTKLMSNLSRSRPVEYMTFATTSAYEHVQLKPLDHMRSQVLGASSQGSAFMFIDAVDPVGTANPRVYDRVREAFESARPFEPWLGGEPIEDVAVYFSSESKMDHGENGSSLAELEFQPGPYPHLQAVRGACRILQRAHLAFGVITRRQLDDLDRYRVLVLPNVSRMDGDEVAAIRAYVGRGGRVYASGYTSLVETSGVRHDDFMLADVFGVHLDSEELGRVMFVRPATDRMRKLFDPQRHLTATPLPGALEGGLLRVRLDRGTRLLATLSLPYGHPAMGHVDARNWGSIHASPPWDDTDVPVLVDRRHGDGRAVYSSLDIEREESDASDRLFAWLIGDLLGKEASVTCNTHSGVWVTAFRGPEEGTIRITLLNSPQSAVPSAKLRLRRPSGRRWVQLEDQPSGRAVPFRVAADGSLRAMVRRLPELTILVARSEPD
jgi:putative glycosyl hydrolase-like family 6 (GHL6) protein